MSFEVPPFRPRFPWWGGDLQTLASRLRPAPAALGFPECERITIRFADGDTLVAALDRPMEGRSARPLAILIHGLTGSADSLYMRSQAKLLVGLGYTVVRLNLRGAGPSRPLCADQYYAGRSQDFREFLSLLPPELTADGVVAVGYSLGGAMLLKYLGEEGEATPLLAAASVSAPIDLAATCGQMMRRRNWLYHRYILAEMKREALGAGARLSAAERAAIRDARDIWHYDQAFIAPRHGFKGADDYYERCKPVRFMPGIRIPTLVVAALDDPWIPGALYAGYEWTANSHLVPALTRYGGHVGFHGQGGDPPWSDRTIARFFAT